MKKAYWVGSAKDDLIFFPEDVREYFGYQLYKVQKGEKPDDIKYLQGNGFSGVVELRKRFDTDIYRTVYTTKISSCVYILHAFKKKSMSTSKKDIDTIKKRL